MNTQRWADRDRWRRIASGLILGIAAGSCSLLAPEDSALRGGGNEAGADGSTLDGGGQGGARDADRPDAVSDADAREAGSCDTWRDCSGGAYCKAGRCVSCGDLSSLDSLAGVEFDEPEPLSVINGSIAIEALRFPRVFEGEGTLVYSRDFFGGQTWLTQDFARDVGLPLGPPIEEESRRESGAIRVPFAMTGAFANYNFLFHRSEPNPDAGTLHHNELYGATVDAAGITTRITRLPEPFNLPLPTIGSSYSIAVSKRRAFWMVNPQANLNAYLRTAALDGDEAVDITVELPGCQLRDLDYAPWVTPDGRILFVTVTESADGGCPASPFDGPTDIYMLRLGDDGMPTGPLIPFKGASEPEVRDTDASLSPDACWLYFASDRDLDASVRRLRFYRAHRLQ